MQSIEQAPVLGLPNDGGPIYAETDLTALISEPWNAISSLAIIFPALYWAFKLQWQYKTYPFIFFCVPLLIMGGLGSTFYHAFRTSEFLLWLDVLPTAVLTFSVGVYFWLKILPKWWHTISIVVPFTILRYAIFDYFPGHFATNLSYFISGVIIFLPVVIYLLISKFTKWQYIIASIFFLGLSLYFREADMRFTDGFPMGSHFLWHLFSGVGAYYLAKYLHFIRESELEISEKS